MCLIFCRLTMEFKDCSDVLEKRASLCYKRFLVSLLMCLSWKDVRYVICTGCCLRSFTRSIMLSLWLINCYSINNTYEEQLADKVWLFLWFQGNLCPQVSCRRPTTTRIVTLSQAVKPVTYFLWHRTDVVPLTLQSAVKDYYPQVILLIPQKHPVVTGNAIRALNRTRYRMWDHTAVSVSVTNDIAINMSSLLLVSGIIFCHSVNSASNLEYSWPHLSALSTYAFYIYLNCRKVFQVIFSWSDDTWQSATKSVSRLNRNR